MELVIDANILLSAMIATEGKTSELLLSENIHLLAPEYLLEEFEKYRKVVLQKTGFTESELEVFLSIASSRIRFVPYHSFESFMHDAVRICPDPKDVIYFALAMRYNCPIWTNDKKLKEQNVVEIINTSELLSQI